MNNYAPTGIPFDIRGREPTKSAMSSSFGSGKPRAGVAFDHTASSHYVPSQTSGGSNGTPFGGASNFSGLDGWSSGIGGDNYFGGGGGGWFGAGSNMSMDPSGTPTGSIYPPGSNFFVIPPLQDTAQTATNTEGPRLNDKAFEYLSKWDAAREALAASARSESKVTLNPDGSISSRQEWTTPTVTDTMIEDYLVQKTVDEINARRAAEAAAAPRKWHMFRTKSKPVTDEEKRPIRMDVGAAAEEYRRRQSQASNNPSNQSWQNTQPSGFGSSNPTMPISHSQPFPQSHNTSPTMPTTEQTQGQQNFPTFAQNGLQQPYSQGNYQPQPQNMLSTQGQTQQAYTANSLQSNQTNKKGNNPGTYVEDTPTGRIWHFDPGNEREGVQELKRVENGREIVVTLTFDYTQAGKGGPTEINSTYINKNPSQSIQSYPQPQPMRSEASWPQQPPNQTNPRQSFRDTYNEAYPNHNPHPNDWARVPHTPEGNRYWATLEGNENVDFNTAMHRHEERERIRERLGTTCTFPDMTADGKSVIADTASRFYVDALGWTKGNAMAADDALKRYLTEKNVTMKTAGVTDADITRANEKAYWRDHTTEMYDGTYKIPDTFQAWQSLGTALDGYYSGKTTDADRLKGVHRSEVLNNTLKTISTAWKTNLWDQVGTDTTGAQNRTFDAARAVVMLDIDRQSFISSKLEDLRTMDRATGAYKAEFARLKKLDATRKAELISGLQAAGVYTLADASSFRLFSQNPLKPPDMDSEFDTYEKSLAAPTTPTTPTT